MSRGLRWAYLIVAVLFLAAVSAQALMAGLALFWRSSVWESHIGIGHMAAGLPLIMLVLALAGRLPSRLRPLTGLLVLGVVLQAELFPLIRELSGLASAYHPFLAVLLFYGGARLAQRAWVLVRSWEPVAVSAPLEVPAYVPRSPLVDGCDPAAGMSCA